MTTECEAQFSSAFSPTLPPVSQACNYFILDFYNMPLPTCLVLLLLIVTGLAGNVDEHFVRRSRHANHAGRIRARNMTSTGFELTDMYHGDSFLKCV